MFQVLRQANQRDGTYILESTSPPFEKRDQAQFVRLACLRCREKKVRCTGDKNGCQRCRDKGVKCSYASSLASTSASTTSSTTTIASSSTLSVSMLTPPATATGQQSIAITSFSNTPVVPMSDGFSEAEPRVSSTIFDGNTTAYDFSHIESNFLHDTSTSLLHGPFSSPSSTSISSIHPTFSSFHDFLHEPLLNFPMDGPKPTPRRAPSVLSQVNTEQVTRSDLDPTNCYSSHDILQAFEAVEVCLVWAPRASNAANASPLLLGIDEMLTCQKEVLESCRARLQCKACRFQSYDAVIIMNICEKLLGSILRVKAVVDNQRSHDFTQSPNPRLPFFPSSTASSYSLAEQVMFQKQDNQHSQRVLDTSPNRITNFDSQGLDLGLGEWRVDDEDKLHVLASLLRIRMMKLKHLVQQLEEVVTSSRWLMHATMVKDLSGYISKCQGGIFDS
ncbi:hypothetical protein GGR51DRAFT_510877 [Nemania sp. FL0031]|nr:hypothetical protein GGR51DRAFT_510877 [Nemania sp. FL0031]